MTSFQVIPFDFYTNELPNKHTNRKHTHKHTDDNIQHLFFEILWHFVVFTCCPHPPKRGVPDPQDIPLNPPLPKEGVQKNQCPIFNKHRRVVIGVKAKQFLPSIKLYSKGFLQSKNKKIKNRTAYPEAHLNQEQQSHKPPADPLRPWFFFNLMPWTNFGTARVMKVVSQVSSKLCV